MLQEEEVTPTVKRKYIEVVKNRFHGELGAVPLYFNKPTLTMSKKIYLASRKEKKAKEEM